MSENNGSVIPSSNQGIVIMSVPPIGVTSRGAIKAFLIDKKHKTKRATMFGSFYLSFGQ